MTLWTDSPLYIIMRVRIIYVLRSLCKHQQYTQHPNPLARAFCMITADYAVLLVFRNTPNKITFSSCFTPSDRRSSIKSPAKTVDAVCNLNPNQKFDNPSAALSKWLVSDHLAGDESAFYYFYWFNDGGGGQTRFPQST